MGIKEHTERELDILESRAHDDGEQHMVNQDIKAVMDLLASQGHSGFSIGYVMAMVDRLAKFKPLLPLTGEDDEWELYQWGDSEPYYQNIRDSSVFRNTATGKAYDIDQIALTYKGGSNGWSRGGLAVSVTFPYTPRLHPYIVELPNDSRFNGDESTQDIIDFIQEHKHDSDDMLELSKVVIKTH